MDRLNQQSGSSFYVLTRRVVDFSLALPQQVGARGKWFSLFFFIMGSLNQQSIKMQNQIDYQSTFGLPPCMPFPFLFFHLVAEHQSYLHFILFFPQNLPHQLLIWLWMLAFHPNIHGFRYNGISVGPREFLQFFFEMLQLLISIPDDLFLFGDGEFVVVGFDLVVKDLILQFGDDFLMGNHLNFLRVFYLFQLRTFNLFKFYFVCLGFDDMPFWLFHERVWDILCILINFLLPSIPVEFLAFLQYLETILENLLWEDYFMGEMTVDVERYQIYFCQFAKL